MRRASGITLSILAIVAAVSLLPVAAAASSITQTYSFTASGFTPVFAGPSAPIDSVSGDATLTFDPFGATQGTVDAINLTIAAHTYTPAEVGFTYPFATNTILIGGELNGSGIVGGTDDFWLRFDPQLLIFGDFVYASSSVLGDIWTTESGTVSVSNNAVPEPASLALLVVGLGGVAVRRLRRS